MCIELVKHKMQFIENVTQNVSLYYGLSYNKYASKIGNRTAQSVEMNFSLQAVCTRELA